MNLIPQHGLKAQRLAAVTKTAIAANHEINSPLTTILLKLDMLTGESHLSQPARKALLDIKNEVLAIRTIVKRMLEITDVVETPYAQNEKMLDLRASQGTKDTPCPAPAQQGRMADGAGFEDLAQASAKPAPSHLSDAGSVSFEHIPGFEDYLEDKAIVTKSSPQAQKASCALDDTPGFERYHEARPRKSSSTADTPPKGRGVTTDDTPGFEDYLDK